MWQSIRSRVIALLIFIGTTHGLLIMGPKFIRANQNYTMVISNFNSDLNKVDLMVNVAGQADNGLSALNVTKTVEVRKFMNRVVNFNMPKDLSAGSYKITIDGQRGFSFHKEAGLVYLDKSISGLIQIDKPVFNPGDTMKFRVIVLDTKLKPPSSVRSVYVTVRDPQKNVIRKWAFAKLYAGVFESDLQIAPTPMLGIWNISVQVEEEELVSKTFEVKEYVLSTFDVQIVPTVVPLEEHQALKLTIAANYHFGKPVNGLAKLELYLDDDKLDQKKQLDVFGMGQVELRFADFLEVYGDHQDVRVKVSFIEQYTNRTVVKTETIKVFKYPYRVELVKESPQFRPGHTYKCALKFTYHDGTPASDIEGNVEINVDHIPPADTSDSKGLIKLELQPAESTEVIDISFSIDDIDFFFFDKVEIVTNAYVKLELKSPVKLNRHLRLIVTCTERMTFLVYYVVSKGNIIDAGYMRPNKQTKYSMQLNATEKMVPKAKIIVATVASRTVVFDYVDIDFQELRNNFDLIIVEREVKPGRQIELSMSGRPGAYVGLAAYDKALLLHSKHHDLFWEDIEQVFEGFHGINANEFDKLHDLGVFCLTLDGISMANDISYRSGNQERNTIYNPVLRNHFLQSWLWKNVTIGNSGSIKLIENVPDTITSWYLTGFSIDPVYGLGIIKQPIELTTVQPFYIVDNLPYSIKRGEVAVLQFTLFHNLDSEYIADVTLYNVANQMEFIGRPQEDTHYSKSIFVPPNVGVPLSFFVKARKLGEMVIRVKASLADRQETDALVKVIRVLPESLVQPKTDKRFILSQTNTSRTSTIPLFIDKKRDDGSIKIEIRLHPNVYPMEIYNLSMYVDNLLANPSVCVEQTKVGNFVLNVVVLDYLNAIRSKEQSLINRAIELLHENYQNQMRYRQTDGSFGVRSNSGGSVFLTAYVVKSMQTASKYITEVNAHMVEKAYDWLASNQQSSGRFDEVGSIIHKDMQKGLRNGIALTSYVLVALLENDYAKVKHAMVIQNGMSYLSSQYNYISNAYDLSIATYAMMLNGHSLKDAALKKLIDMSWANDQPERYWNTSNSIEATSYALLSFVKSENYVNGIHIANWLLKQFSVAGCDSHTFGTVMTLIAATKIAEKMLPSRNNYTVRMKADSIEQNFYFNAHNVTMQKMVLTPERMRYVEFNVSGVGGGFIEVFYQYSLDLRNFEHRFNLMLEKQNTGSDYELRLRVCASFIPELRDIRSNMALVELNFPSGYVVDQNPISEWTTVNPIKNIEIRYGGTSVVVYYDNMGKETNCFTVTALRRFKVALKRPAYVVVYDYYDRSLNAIKVYEADKQNVCEICDQDDCPPECMFFV